VCLAQMQWHAFDLTWRHAGQQSSHGERIWQRLREAEGLQSGECAREDAACVLASCNAERPRSCVDIEDVAVRKLVEAVVDSSNEPRGTGPQYGQPEPFDVFGASRES